MVFVFQKLFTYLYKHLILQMTLKSSILNPSLAKNIFQYNHLRNKTPKHVLFEGSQKCQKSLLCHQLKEQIKFYYHYKFQALEAAHQKQRQTQNNKNKALKNPTKMCQRRKLRILKGVYLRRIVEGTLNSFNLFSNILHFPRYSIYKRDK